MKDNFICFVIGSLMGTIVCVAMWSGWLKKDFIEMQMAPPPIAFWVVLIVLCGLRAVGSKHPSQ